MQQIVEKTRINKAKLLLTLEGDMNREDPGHACEDWKFVIESHEKACETIDNLVILEDSVPKETKTALVYIAGYATRKDSYSDYEETAFYYEKCGQYTEALDRGGLKKPSDRACQWTIFCFIVFNVVKDSVCRNSFTKIALMISEMFSFEMEEKNARVLSNIFLKNYCTGTTPRSTKAPALKRVKLAESN